MKRFIEFTAIAAFAVIVAVGVTFLAPQPTIIPTRVGGLDGSIYTMQRSAVVSVTTSSTNVAATSTSRRYMMIQNDSATELYCITDGKVAYSRAGFFINASSSIEFKGETTYTGSINCIASSTANVLVIEAN